MSVLQTITEVSIALLALAGAYSLLHMLSAAILHPRGLTTAVVLRNAVDEFALDILLGEAVRNPGRRRGERVVLLVSRSLMDGRMGFGECLLAPLAEVADRYGAVVYIVDTDID